VQALLISRITLKMRRLHNGSLGRLVQGSLTLLLIGGISL